MSLLQTLQIQEVAFEWDSVKRIYRCDSLTIQGIEDRKDREMANGDIDFFFNGVWLVFRFSARYAQRIAPEASAANDILDILNALQDREKTVRIYPVHDVDDGVFYNVRLWENMPRDLLSASKGLYSPSVSLIMITESQLSEYPAWLRTARHR